MSGRNGYHTGVMKKKHHKAEQHGHGDDPEERLELGERHCDPVRVRVNVQRVAACVLSGREGLREGM